MYPKSLFASKTFWVNVLTALAAVLVEFSNIPDMGIDPKWMLFALAIVNVILRTITSQPVKVGA